MLDEQNLYNPYVFPGNNPVGNVDPMGLGEWEVVNAEKRIWRWKPDFEGDVPEQDDKGRWILADGATRYVSLAEGKPPIYSFADEGVFDAWLAEKGKKEMARRKAAGARLVATRARIRAAFEAKWGTPQVMWVSPGGEENWYVFVVFSKDTATKAAIDAWSSAKTAKAKAKALADYRARMTGFDHLSEWKGVAEEYAHEFIGTADFARAMDAGNYWTAAGHAALIYLPAVGKFKPLLKAGRATKKGRSLLRLGRAGGKGADMLGDVGRATRRLSAGERRALQHMHRDILGKLARNRQVPMPKGTASAQLMSDLSNATGREVALLRLQDGRRVLRLGNRAGKVSARGASRIIAHTHPSGDISRFSGDDLWQLVMKRKQRSSVLIAPGTGSVMNKPRVVRKALP